MRKQGTEHRDRLVLQVASSAVSMSCARGGQRYVKETCDAGSGSAWPTSHEGMASRCPHLGGGHIDRRPAVRCVKVDEQVLVRAVLAARMDEAYGTRVRGRHRSTAQAVW